MEEESKRQWQEMAKQKDNHIKELQDQVQQVSQELCEERQKITQQLGTPLIKNSQKQSNLKKTISTENFHTSPKTVRFREENGDDSDNDIDTAEARRRNPKPGRQFLLGDGKGS